MAEQQSALSITERQAGDVVVLVLTGEITLDDGDLKMGRRVDELLKKGCRKILLDMAGVSYIDSAGVGMMAGKLKTVREKGGDMKLLHMTNRGQKLFGMMKLNLAFETFDDEALAVKSFAFKNR